MVERILFLLVEILIGIADRLVICAKWYRRAGKNVEAAWGRYSCFKHKVAIFVRKIENFLDCLKDWYERIE